MWLSPSGQVAHTTLDWRLCRTRIFSGCNSGKPNGNTACFKWENGNTAPEKAELTVQVSSAPSTVQITGYSYTQS